MNARIPAFVARFGGFFASLLLGGLAFAAPLSAFAYYNSYPYGNSPNSPFYDPYAQACGGRFDPNRILCEQNYLQVTQPQPIYPDYYNPYQQQYQYSYYWYQYGNNSCGNSYYYGNSCYNNYGSMPNYYGYNPYSYSYSY